MWRWAITAIITSFLIAMALLNGSWTHGLLAMPSGATAIWFMDQYDSTAQAVPNSLTVGATPLSADLIGFPRRNFNGALFGSNFSLVSATVTDNDTVAPDGTTEASTIVGTGAVWRLQTTLPLISGQSYTIGATVKAASSQTFKLGTLSDGSSGVLTATTSWQRFSFTFTAGATATRTIFPIGSDGTNNATLKIVDVQLFSGSSDLNVNWATKSPTAGHLVFRKANGRTAPSFSSGQLDFSAGANAGVASLEHFATFSNLTSIIIYEKTTAGGDNNQAWLTDYVDSSALRSYFENFGEMNFFFNGLSSDPNQLAGLNANPAAGYHMLAHRYNGSVMTISVDESLWFTTAKAPTPISAADFGVGNYFGTTSSYKVAAAALYPRALSDAEIVTAYVVLKSHILSVSGISMGTERYYVGEGDSITEGGFPEQYGPNSSPPLIGYVNAISGSSLATMSARGPALDATLPSSLVGKKYILSVLIGRNDLEGYAGGTTQYAIDLATYLDARRSAGWKVVLCTVLPSTAVGFNTQRNLLNPILTGWAPGLHYDGLADFAANSTMGPDAAASDTSLYSDGTHPTALGQGILATVIQPVINGL